MRYLVKFTSFLIFFLLFASCDESTKVSSPKSGQNSSERLDESLDSGSISLGYWRIDSVAENKLVIDRLVQNPDIQLFHFKKDGTMFTGLLRDNQLEERPSGKWVCKGDSLFILTPAGKRAMSYGFQTLGKTLFLYGNFTISESNHKKPSFFLSKFVLPAGL